VFNHMEWNDANLNLQDPADFGTPGIGAGGPQYNGLGLGGNGASPNFTRIIQLGVRVYF
jgi:hypothetical protein